MGQFTIAQLSDCHLFADADKAGFANVNPCRSLEDVMTSIEQHQPDQVLVTGDISADDSRESYTHFIDITGRYKCTSGIRVLAGNHDNNRWFDAMLGSRVLCAGQPMQLKGWQVHGLDSRHTGTLGHVDAQQLRLVLDCIEQSPNDNHLIAVHHHPVPCNGWMDKHTFVNGEWFMTQLRACSQVKAVIHGHVHMQLEKTEGHISVLGVPSSCWQWENSPVFAIAEQRPGFRLIRLFDDGNFDSRIIRLTN